MTLSTARSRAAPSPGSTGGAAGGPAGRDAARFLSQQKHWPEGWELPQAACRTQSTTSSCPCPLASLLPFGYFTCKYIWQLMPAFSMTSPGNRKKTPCQSLGIKAKKFWKSHEEVQRWGVPKQGSWALGSGEVVKKERFVITRDKGSNVIPLSLPYQIEEFPEICI